MKDIKLFIPLLFLYIVITAVFSSNEFHGDEGRYLKYATNLSKGYYSEKDNIKLNNGPGYPIILLPFVLLKLPLITAKFFNSVLLFIAIQYFYHTLRFYIEKKPAITSAYLLGIYPPILRLLPYLSTDVLAFFLVCGFVFHFCKMHKNKRFSKCQFFSASIYLAYLALTRTIFGYVILFGLIFFVIIILIKKSSPAKTSSLAFLAALLWCSPYLVYTYHLTGKLFYWGTNGGVLLYFMTSPYPGELGDWISPNRVLGASKAGRFDTTQLVKNHKNFYEEIKPFPPVQRDSKFRNKAIQNIIHYPKKYIKNIIANVGRLLFNYPYSYTPQKLDTYFYLVPNMFIIISSIFCTYTSLLSKNLIPFEIKVLLLFSTIYIGGSSLVSAQARYFTFIVPVIILWLTFLCSRTLKIEIRK